MKKDEICDYNALCWETSKELYKAINEKCAELSAKAPYSIGVGSIRQDMFLELLSLLLVEDSKAFWNIAKNLKDGLEEKENRSKT